MRAQPYKIISVGGSIVIPKSGFDIDFLKKFRLLILGEVKKGSRFILVVGGGATCRVYQDAARQVVPLAEKDLDWIGIHSTVFNAQFVKFLFKGYAHDAVVTDPTKKVKTKKPILIAAGWKPGCSTDKDAVLLAKTYHAREVINLSNIEYVYDKDPNKFPDAAKIESITWHDFRRHIVGNRWEAGKSAPFDPIASQEAERFRLTIRIVKGTDLTRVKEALRGTLFTGTTIHP